ncbi:hypothetical protein BDQ17DRAFT_1336326 [Cyathus striatus]|nr:hypothetical protein BDQ17DRAFT_1336326 [Cyathus striatus]
MPHRFPLAEIAHKKHYDALNTSALGVGTVELVLVFSTLDIPSVFSWCFLPSLQFAFIRIIGHYHHVGLGEKVARANVASLLQVYQNQLCTPSLPFMKRERRMAPFYALDADLPLILTISSGLQHALAMLAALITPPSSFRLR